MSADDLAALRAELAAERERADRAEKTSRTLDENLARVQRHLQHMAAERDELLSLAYTAIDGIANDETATGLREEAERIEADAALAGVPTNERETDGALIWARLLWAAYALHLDDDLLAAARLFFEPFGDWDYDELRAAALASPVVRERDSHEAASPMYRESSGRYLIECDCGWEYEGRTSLDASLAHESHVRERDTQTGSDET